MERKVSGDICPVIHSLTKKYKGSIEGKKVNVAELKGFDRIFSLDLDTYVNFADIVLQNMSRSRFDIKINYLETVFEMLGVSRKACTGKVNLKYDLNYFGSLEEFKNVYEKSFESSFIDIDYPEILTNMGVTYIQESTHVDLYIDTKLVIDINSRRGDMSMYSLAIEFYKRLEGSICKYGDFTFNSIALSNKSNIYYIGEGDKFQKYFNSGHANILLVMKNNSNGEIKFYLYEPHGYDSEVKQIKLVKKSSRIFVELLKDNLESIYKMKKRPCNIEILDSVSVSCPKGVQAYVNDSLGYCKLISTLWLYLVLGLFSSEKISPEVKIELFQNLQIVETCLYGYYKESKELYNVVVNFSGDVLNNYLKHIGDENFIKEFNTNMLLRMKLKMEAKQLPLYRMIDRPAMEAREDQRMFEADTHAKKDEYLILE